MNNFKNSYIAILLISICMLANTSEAREYPVFDLVYAHNKPNLEGWTPMHMIYQWAGYGGQHTTSEQKNYEIVPVKYLKCCYFNHHFKEDANFVSIDFEQWPLHRVSQYELGINIKKSISAIKSIRQGMPDGKRIGWYNSGILPNSKFLQRELTKEEYVKWQKGNDRWKEIIDHVDFVQPSVYKSSKDSLEGWARKTTAYLQEARRMANGKPLFAHTSPQMTDDPPKFHSAKDWEYMILLISKHSDGLVIWTFPQKRYLTNWEEHKEFWHHTQNVLNKIWSQN